jgi:hypothetical protein
MRCLSTALLLLSAISIRGANAPPRNTQSQAVAVKGDVIALYFGGAQPCTCSHLQSSLASPIFRSSRICGHCLLCCSTWIARVSKSSGQCEIVIKAWGPGCLHFAELGIYDSDGVKAASTAVLSTTYPGQEVVKCFDENVETHCETAVDDPAPSLMVSWACAGGSASGYHVDATNRMDCCQEKIVNGSLTAYNSDGSTAGSVYTFATLEAQYTILLGSTGKRSLAICCSCAGSASIVDLII